MIDEDSAPGTVCRALGLWIECGIVSELLPFPRNELCTGQTLAFLVKWGKHK